MVEAIRDNDISRVKGLLDSGWLGVDEYIDHHSCMNSLQLCCLMGRTAILEYLLLRGADVNYQPYNRGDDVKGDDIN